MNFTVISALIWTFSWISVSVSQFHTAEVQSGEEVTLMCTNYSSVMTHISWFRLDNGPNSSCISSVFSSDANVSYCDGFENGNFNMSSNITTLFLNINQVNLSDSGLYFCGFYLGENSRQPVMYTATYLKVEEKSNEPVNVTSVILGGLSILLGMVVIVLAVQIRKLYTANKDEQNPQHSQTPEPNYADIYFCQKTRRNIKSGLERKLDQDVVYSTLK